VHEYNEFMKSVAGEYEELRQRQRKAMAEQVGWASCLVAGWLAGAEGGGLAGWFVGWLGGWLAGWFVGLLDGWAQGREGG